MRTVSIFTNDDDQAICFPADLAYEGVHELEIIRDGDTITLRPVRKSWLSFAKLPKADEGFLQQRQDVIGG